MSNGLRNWLDNGAGDFIKEEVMQTEDGKNLSMGRGGSGLTNKPTLAKESGGAVKEENVDQSRIRADVSDTRTITGAGDKQANNWGEQKPIDQ